MKIRIKDNSIRFRLTKPEVAELCEKGYYESRTQFADNAFVYSLQMQSHGEGLSAEFEGEKMTVNIPKELLTGWDISAQIGFENTEILHNNKTLHLLVEKDFTCLDPRTEDESDNYPNPKMI